MSKPYIHAQIQSKRFGGVPEDYMAINQFMDSSKAAIPDNRHRIFFHSAFGIFTVEKLFGQDYKKLQSLKEKYALSDEAVAEIEQYANHVRSNDVNTIKNANGKLVSVRDIAEDHVLCDYANKFIPSAQDFIEHMSFEPWMQNGHGLPSSYKKLQEAENKRFNINPKKETKHVQSYD